MFAYTTWFDILSNAVKLILLILFIHMHSEHWTSDLLGVNNYYSIMLPWWGEKVLEGTCLSHVFDIIVQK